MLLNYCYIRAEFHAHQLHGFFAGIVKSGIVNPQDMGRDIVSILVEHDVQDVLCGSKAKPDFRARRD